MKPEIVANGKQNNGIRIGLSVKKHTVIGIMVKKGINWLNHLSLMD